MTSRGIGDLLRALDATRREQWDSVARILGFVPAADDAAPVPVTVSTEGGRAPTTPVSAATVAADRRRPAEQDETELPRRPVSSTEAISDDSPRWLRVTSLPRPGPPAEAAAPPSHEPLLPPGQAPALLATLCSTTRFTGRVHVRMTVERMARRQPMRRLPRYARQTLARGVRVSADGGEGLKAFVQDRQQVVAALKLLMGEGLVEEGWFLDDPLDEAYPTRAPWPGTPVLLLTDLGIGGGGARRRWPRPDRLLALSRQMAAQGSPVLALVPYPPDRWPPGLDRGLAMVFWDRRITVSAVRGARRAPRAAR